MGFSNFFKKRRYPDEGSSQAAASNRPDSLPEPVTIEQAYASLKIVGHHLVNCKPIGNLSSDVLILPDGITSIGKEALDISANSVDLYVPPTITHIDDEPFRFVKFATICGYPGSYAETFARKHTGFLPTYRFESLDYPDTIVLRSDPEKAAKTPYDPAIQHVMKFELVTGASALPITLPYTLFRASSRSIDLDDDNVSAATVTIKMQDEGRLVAEESHITYSGHNVAHCSTPLITTHDISFEDLPRLIAGSEDENAARYAGMTAENWRQYLQQDGASKGASALPIVQFGRYPQKHGQAAEPIDWYVLDQQDGCVLLLARNGLELIQYSVEEDLMVYPNLERKENWWEGAYRRSIDWESSNLCRWLNTKFVSAAFAEQEQPYLKNTPERVSCLSTEEFGRYLAQDPAASMRPTDYSLWKGARILMPLEGKPLTSFEGHSLWWLRDVVEKDSSYPIAAVALPEGEASDTIACFKTVCARPTIWVSTDYWKATNPR